MKKDIAIKVENLGKQYKIGEKEKYLALRDKLTNLVKLPSQIIRGKKKLKRNNIWALKNVSFEVKRGEVLGIIGPNGAGKSTLLKILSKITEPTEGRAKLKGRVSSLLEVGTGFHSELTGRENIYLNGVILGMTKREIDEKFDKIIEFSEVEKFLDTPVKYYSSGMKVRLAFSVAAHLEPEILLIDEVLAVGDVEFQKKCLGKMEEVAGEGRTVLFVSHNMQSISTLTKKTIFLKSGHLECLGDTDDIISRYIDLKKASELIYKDDQPDLKPKISKVQLFTSLPNNLQKNGDKFVVEITVNTPKPIRGACLSFQIVDSKDRNYAHLWTFDSDLSMCRKAGKYLIRCIIPKLRLYMGKYFLKLYLSEPPGGKQFQILENVCPFEVVMYGIHREFQWQPNICAYLEEASWEIIS